MERVSGAICVEGVSWTHQDNLAMMVANTVSTFEISLINIV